MSQFLRHVGKVGDRKVAVVFREIPGEPHMALVVYTETMNQNIHDPLISAIESPHGQKSKDLADQLNRSYTKDGKIILHVLHREGMMKKIQTNQIVMTPGPGISMRLNELNDMLHEMEKGEEAIKKLAEIDASRGLQDPKDIARRMRGESTVNPTTGDVLGDSSLATNLRQQAAKMAAEAQGLLAESRRLEEQAQSLEPVSAPSTKKKAGRPKKAVVTG